MKKILNLIEIALMKNNCPVFLETGAENPASYEIWLWKSTTFTN